MPSTVSAILLAAGRSRRMGRPKTLLPLGDRPAILQVLSALTAAGVGEVVTVIGGADEALAALLQDAPSRLVRNPDPESDMAASVRLGLSRIDPAATGALVCLADIPLVRSATIRALLEAHAAAPARIVIPRFRGKKGHPLLLPAPVAAEIFGLPTLREVVASDPERVWMVEVEDEGVVLDMDTPEDYERILARWRA